MELMGERIKRLRTEKRMTQAQVAKRCGVTNVAVWHWENHFVKPQADSLKELAKMFDVSIDVLVTGRETPRTAALHRAIRAGASQSALLAMLPVEKNDNA